MHTLDYIDEQCKLADEGKQTNLAADNKIRFYIRWNSK